MSESTKDWNEERSSDLEEIRELNRTWVLEVTPLPARPGLLRPLRQFGKRILVWVVQRALTAYLLEERHFLGNLVRLQNHMAARLDATAEKTVRLEVALQSLEERLNDETERLSERTESLHRVLERRLESLENAMERSGG